MGYGKRSANNALERLLRPLSRELSEDLARALVKVKADDVLQSRYDELADKHSAGQATPDEQTELEAIVRANTLLGLLKAEAHNILANGQHH